MNHEEIPETLKKKSEQFLGEFLIELLEKISEDILEEPLTKLEEDF